MKLFTLINYYAAQFFPYQECNYNVRIIANVDCRKSIHIITFHIQ